MSLGDWLSEGTNWVFLLISIPTLVAGWRVVTTQNIVRAILYLVVTLGGTAALFLLLGAEFVGWTVVLVYIGAVIILFLIGIMITRAPLGTATELSHPVRILVPAGLLSLVLFAFVSWALVDSFGADAIPVGEDATRSAQIGQVMFERFVIPFEVVSVVLLAALIGAIALARMDQEEVEA